MEFSESTDISGEKLVMLVIMMRRSGIGVVVRGAVVKSGSLGIMKRNVIR